MMPCEGQKLPDGDWTLPDGDLTWFEGERMLPEGNQSRPDYGQKRLERFAWLAVEQRDRNLGPYARDGSTIVACVQRETPRLMFGVWGFVY